MAIVWNYVGRVFGVQNRFAAMSQQIWPEPRLYLDLGTAYLLILVELHYVRFKVL